MDSVRDGVLLVPRAVDVFLSSCSDKFCSPAQSQFDVGVVPQLQFINSVDGVRDGVLLVLPSVVHRDSAFFSSWLWLLQYIDKVVDVLGTRLLYGGL